MSSTQFTADIEDIHFVMFDQLDVGRTLKDIPRYADFDRETCETLLDGAYALAREVMAPINGSGDRQGCRVDGDGNVTTPDGFKAAWNAVAEGGWLALTAPADAGGTGAPAILALATTELFSGAAMAFQMYPGLTGAAARVLYQFGPPGRSKEVAAKMFAGAWAGTMCLTEADAGSAVGDNRCKAVAVGDGVFHLEGEKIFISSGDHDLAENICHLVLARLPDAPAGTKGLSLFLVPKFWFDLDLELKDRNGAFVVSIEEKMGIHGSATCVLGLGQRGPCRAWMIGQPGEGMELMFHMMNEARIGVALQGLAIGAAAYQYSRSYVHERTQGTSLKDFKDAHARRVPIVEHPDVRRMLMTQKVHVETMRSMIYRIGHRLDVAMSSGDPAVGEKLKGQIELMVPVLKAYCTDVGFDVAVTAVQIFGGYGYIGEYPVEQLVRDGKIMSIYEGTNGIQAMDLLGRKMRIGSGALFMEWMQDVQKLLAKASKEGFEAEADAIGKSVNALAASAMHLGGLGMQRRLDAAMIQAVPFLRTFGTVALAVEALVQARVAQRCIAERGETPLLVGKLLNLRFYVRNVLPIAVAMAKSIQTADETCMDERLFQAPG